MFVQRRCRNARLVEKTDDGDPPEWVKMVPRFYTDLKALLELTEQPKPSRIPLRASNDKAIYCICDASGIGFVSIFWSRIAKLFMQNSAVGRSKLPRL